MLINRRQALIGSVGAAAGLSHHPAFGQVPPLKKKDTLQGRLRPDREQQSLASRADRQHEG